MKKVIITLVVMVTMAFSFCVCANAKNTPVGYNFGLVKSASVDSLVSKYDFNINYKNLEKCLNVTSEQRGDFELMFDKFKRNIRFAKFESDSAKSDTIAKNAIMTNVKDMRGLLNRKQYKKYLTILNATVRNKEINI